MKQWKKYVACAVALLFVILPLVSCGNAAGSGNTQKLVETGVFTFADGVAVSTWSFPAPNDGVLSYRLENGTELLSLRIPRGLGYSGSEAEAVVPAGARDNITAFYDQSGAFYDVNEYLEKAYLEYKAAEDQSEFQAYFLDQYTLISGVDKDYVYCTTHILYPVGKGLSDSYTLIHTFDKESGTLIDTDSN